MSDSFAVCGRMGNFFLALTLVCNLSVEVVRSSELSGPAFSSGHRTVSVPIKPDEPKPYPKSPSEEAIKWAEKELRRMSIEEKIGQLISIGINANFLNQESDAYRALKHQVEANHIGGIVLFRGLVYESVVLMNRMQQL